MKAKLTLLVTILSVQLLIAQSYQTVEEVNDACSQLGFSGDEDAQIAVDNILEQIGVFRNFTIQECPDINNAVAKNIEISPGHKERYILYDTNFFSRINDKAANDWAAISILAHEIGHHLNGHALNDKGSNHRFELEADYSCGFYLAKMGATLEEAQSAIQTLKYEKATRTHPAKIDRLAAIEKGWNKGKGITISNTVDIEVIKVVENEIIDEQVGEDEIVIVDDDEAIEFYKKGEIEYQNFNYTEAIAHFEKAIEHGSIDAYYYLSNCYYFGQGTKIDYTKAFKLADEGYKKGSIPSTYQLGKYYANGFGVTKNKETANRLFQKDFQIKWFLDQFDKTNSGFHAYTIGYMYGEGYGGVKESIRESLRWYDKAVNLNNPIAQSNLGSFYQKGYEYDEALKWYRKAAEQGFALGQYNLGMMYQLGYGVSKDYKEALKWYLKAAEQGSFYGQYGVGSIYQNGYDAVKQDYKEALKWFHMAAEQVYAPAQFMLGYMYYQGYGVTKNKDDAIYWFKKAAKQDFKKSQDALRQLGETW